MAEWVEVGTKSEIAPGATKVIVHEDAVVLVANVEGEFYAVGNRCPHAGGSLEQGFIEDGRVVCPWHGWSFPLSPIDPPNDCLPRYRVNVDGETVRIEFPELEADKGWR